MSHKISIEDLRIQNHLEEIQGEDIKKEIKVGKPNKQLFFRVHPDSDFRCDTKLLKYDPDNQWYYVVPDVKPLLNEELSSVKLVTCMYQSGELSVWPIKLPSDRQNKWTRSALEAADLATKAWTRLVPDMSKGTYRIQKALSEMAEPEWPEMSFMEVINDAFSDFIIDSLDHPIVKLLRGKQ